MIVLPGESSMDVMSVMVGDVSGARQGAEERGEAAEPYWLRPGLAFKLLCFAAAGFVVELREEISVSDKTRIVL